MHRILRQGQKVAFWDLFWFWVYRSLTPRWLLTRVWSNFPTMFPTCRWCTNIMLNVKGWMLHYNFDLRLFLATSNGYRRISNVFNSVTTNWHKYLYPIKACHLHPYPQSPVQAHLHLLVQSFLCEHFLANCWSWCKSYLSNYLCVSNVYPSMISRVLDVRLRVSCPNPDNSCLLCCTYDMFSKNCLCRWNWLIYPLFVCK